MVIPRPSAIGEALEQAETADFDGVPFRVVGAAHLAGIALSVGRAKDYARILEEAWIRFKRRFIDG